MQHLAEQLCSTQFTPLEKRRHAAAIGFLCKLLDGTCREHLQRFCPLFLYSISLLYGDLNIWTFYDHFEWQVPLLLPPWIYLVGVFLDVLLRFQNWMIFALLFVRVGLNLQVACNILFVMFNFCDWIVACIWACDYRKKIISKHAGAELACGQLMGN